MKTIEFSSMIGPGGILTIPSSVTPALSTDKTVRVMVLLDDNNADDEWDRAAARSFGLGYADSDAIYDQLSTIQSSVSSLVR